MSCGEPGGKPRVATKPSPDEAIAAIEKLGGGFELDENKAGAGMHLPSRITNAGLAQLKGVTKLKTLMLQRTKITDAGLKDLAKLKNIHHLSMTDTKVTKAAVDRLHKVLNKNEGGCFIVHYQQQEVA
jgi:hypothetical protein